MQNKDSHVAEGNEYQVYVVDFGHNLYIQYTGNEAD